MLSRIGLYLRTVRYLTLTQIYFQVYYRLKRTFLNRPPLVAGDTIARRSLLLDQSIPSQLSYLGNHTFKFLNQQVALGEHVDWNFSANRKLWTYNLNYFDFLHQPKLTKLDAIELLNSFCESASQLKDGVEPYPISVRGVNWIKYFIYHDIRNLQYDTLLKAHYRHLSSNIEYHLLGNHILENAFSLVFASFYFEDTQWYDKSKRLLERELREQILHDGAHFELSPMYHQILLYRLLDVINLVKGNRWKEDSLLHLLELTACRMMGWLKAITFSNGEIPMVNDSTPGIAPSTNELLDYGRRLGLEPPLADLSDSGYRMVRTSAFEMFLDIGKIGPDYIPGHAHSDTLSFVLYVDGSPMFVDPGVTTYDIGPRRLLERSTVSHNTVMINGENQSEVWSSFRVGRRAKVFQIQESIMEVAASHDGYGHLGIAHRRTWVWDERALSIIDELSSNQNDYKAVASLNVHPDYIPVVDGDIITIGSVKIKSEGSRAIHVEQYSFATGFNSSRVGQTIRIDFKQRLALRILFPN